MVHNRFSDEVISICTGWFEEIGEDFDKINTMLACEAAPGDDDMTISPLINTDRVCAFPIMLTV